MSETELIEERLHRFVMAPRDPDWQDVLRRANVTPVRNGVVLRLTRLPRRRLIAGVVAAVALAVPAVAFSGELGSLFGFSNQGTPVPQDDLSVVSAARTLTAKTPGRVVQLASRDGWTFYAARTASGHVCYFDESATPILSGWRAIGSGSCKDTAADADFPSPTRPVFDMSSYFGMLSSGASIERLAGVAADGVASVQVLAISDCHVVATAPVIDNVYIADKLPMTPEAVIVARDASGNAVWYQAATGAIQPAPPTPSCGLG
jgi:hypothetical protein